MGVVSPWWEVRAHVSEQDSQNRGTFIWGFVEANVVHFSPMSNKLSIKLMKTDCLIECEYGNIGCFDVKNI